MDPWRVLRGPLLLPWESGFGRELGLGSGRASVESLQESTSQLVAVGDRTQPTKRGLPSANDAGAAKLHDPATIEAEARRIEDSERSSLVNQFASWVYASSTQSMLHIQLHQAKASRMVADALMERSTSTLRVRIGALRRLEGEIGRNPLDVNEPQLYNLLCSYR